MKKESIKRSIIILRNKERGKDLKEILIKQGFNVLVKSIIKIKRKKYTPINIKLFDAIIFTSVNSVKFIKENINNNIFKNINTFCVGKITEKYAIESGFKCIKTKAYSGKTLEKEILNQTEIKINNIAIFSGNKMAHNPIPKLKQNGINATRIVLYDAIPEKHINKKILDFIFKQNTSHIVFYSPHIADTFNKLTEKYNFSTINAVCLGKNTKKILEKRKWKKVLIVKNVESKSFANSILES